MVTVAQKKKKKKNTLPLKNEHKLPELGQHEFPSEKVHMVVLTYI